MISPVFPTAPKFEATMIAAKAMGAIWFDRLAHCSDCGHLGRYFAEDLSIYPDGGHFLTKACKCAAQTDLGTKALMRDAGIPSTYQTATFDNWTNTGRVPTETAANAEVLSRLKAIAARIEEAREDGLHVWIYGSNGTGKTWLATALMRAAMLRGFSGRYIDASAIMRTSIDDKESMSNLHDVGVLLIDGVQNLTRSRTDYAEGVLVDLVQYRVANRFMTIFTGHEKLSSIARLDEVLNDTTVRYALVGGRFQTGVSEKWQ